MLLVFFKILLWPIAFKDNVLSKACQSDGTHREQFVWFPLFQSFGHDVPLPVEATPLMELQDYKNKEFLAQVFLCTVKNVTVFIAKGMSRRLLPSKEAGSRYSRGLFGHSPEGTTKFK